MESGYLVTSDFIYHTNTGIYGDNIKKEVVVVGIETVVMVVLSHIRSETRKVSDRVNQKDCQGILPERV